MIEIQPGERNPIIYETQLLPRWADLDPYGHVNATVYLDLVATGRFLYCETALGLPPQEFIRRGIAFYMTSAKQDFLRSIDGLKQVLVRSWTHALKGRDITIHFEIIDPVKQKPYAKGEITYACIDLTTKRPCETPDWVVDAMFQK